MKQRRKKLIYFGLQTAIVVVMTWVLSFTVIDNIADMTSLQLSIERKDYIMSDVYNTVANKRPVLTLSDDILIVGVDGCSRNQIADIISIINDNNPAVIGLDILFTWEYEEDKALIESLKSCKNLVMPDKLTLDSEGNIYSSSESSYFTDSLNCQKGVINVEAYSIGQSVREFRPYFETQDGKHESFSVAIAKLYRESSVKTLNKRNNELETITYVSREINTVDSQDLYDEDTDLTELISGKIVLIGDVNDIHDFHVTPVDEGMPGLKVHAYTIDTIITENYVRTTSRLLNWFIAALLSAIFVALNFFIQEKVPNAGNFWVRVLQVALLFLLFLLGCRLFASHGVFVDFAPTLAMLSLSLFIYDVWIGIVGVIKYFYRKKKSKTETSI